MTDVKRLPRSAHYSIKAPRHLFRDMRRDVALLRKHGRYVSCTTIVLCCLDALAADSGGATRGKFVAFVQRHFSVLCAELRKATGRPGAEVLYAEYRNGMAHLRGPRSGFAIAEDHEVDGSYARHLHFDGVGTFVAINVDRLIRDFVILTRTLESRGA